MCLMRPASHRLLLASLLLSTFATGIRAEEQALTTPKLTPARGYYARLAAISAAPDPTRADLDALRFPIDPQRREKTLATKPAYLTVDPAAFVLPPCPANSSAQTRAELDYLLRLQATRTPGEIAWALGLQDWGYSLSAKPGDRDYELLRSNLFLVGRSIGTWFNAESLPLTADLMARFWRDARSYVWTFKFDHARVRPYVLEPKIKNLQETDWAAFPSGHASYAYAVAYLYAELAPELSDVFLRDAAAIAYSREVLGVHYPSDSESGRLLARQIVGFALRNPEFQRDLDKVREEWRTVSALRP